MTKGAITFDFHNTIASCDAWFQLEVRHLVSSFLIWHGAANDRVFTAEQLADADKAYRTLRQEIHVHGIEQTAEQCVSTVLTSIGVYVPPDAILEGVHVLMRDTEHQVAPMDGAIETVTLLAVQGVRLGIVSSAVYHPFLEWTLERFGIREAFASVVTSASSGYYKSRREIYHVAAEALSVAPEDVVHVGDSLKFDVGGAQRAGMRTVMINNAASSPADGEPVPHLILPSLTDAAPAILGLLTSAR